MSIPEYQKVEESLTRANPDGKLSALASDCYLSLKELAQYSGLSLSLLKRRLRGNGTDALPHFNTGGKILVKKSEFDQWFEKNYRVVRSDNNTEKIQHITSEICQQLGLSQGKT